VGEPVTAADDGEVAIVAGELLAAGGAPGSSLHSWRCEYPERYGTCTCVRDLAASIVAALRNGAPLSFTERRQHSAERQLTSWPPLNSDWPQGKPHDDWPGG